MSLSTDARPSTARTWLTGAAAVDLGLFAGLFGTFSVAVMPGLAGASDVTFVEAMREINVAILNPVFALVFGGAPLLATAVAVLQWRGRAPARSWALAAAVLALATWAVTFGISVPMNDALAAVGDPHALSAAQVAAARADYETPWTLWNAVRSVLSLGAAVASVQVLRLGRRP